MNITDHGIHIFSDDSAAGAWRMTFGGEGRVLVLRDALMCGPLPPITDPASWRAMRIEFWKDTDCRFFDECFGNSDSCGRSLDLFQNLDRLHESAPVYIWAGTDPSDQIFLLFVLAIVRSLGIDPARLRYIPFAHRPDFGLPYYPVAVLNQQDLAAHPEPQTFTREQIGIGNSAWAALTDTEPCALIALTDVDTTSIPFLRNVVVQTLRRYPRRDTGLGNIQQCLLENALRHGPNTTSIIGYSLCGIWESGGAIGDVYLFHQLQRMSRTILPLVQLHGDSALYRDTEVTLTDFGRAVLEGRASSYPTNPIDEWIGGVHLSSAEDRLWFHKDGTLHRHCTES